MNFNNIIKKIVETILKEESGVITLSHGKHEIFIRTKSHHPKVYIHVKPGCSATCAETNEDMYAAKTVHHGFILYADIKSNEGTVDWFTE